MKKTILVMLSGGVDSTFMLYHYLTQTEDAVHVHHISLRYPSEPRWPEEDAASRKIVEYCREIRPFGYSESRFDLGFRRFVGRDSDTQLLVAAKVAPNLEGEVHVALGWQYRDIEATVQRRYDVSQKLWQALCDSMDAPFGERVSRKLLFPLYELKVAKREMIRLLPHELLRLTWSCRRPVRSENGISRVCGTCHACRDIAEAMASL